MKTIQERLKGKNIDVTTKHHAYDYLLKTFQSIAKDIANDAYIDGYQSRVCDQLDAGLAGHSLGAHYTQEELDAKVKSYIDRLAAIAL